MPFTPGPGSLFCPGWSEQKLCLLCCRKLSTRVKPDATLYLGGVCCPGRPVPPLIAELMPPGLIERAQQALPEEQQPEDTGSNRTEAANGKQHKEAAASAAIGSKRSRCVHAENDAAVRANKQQERQQNLFAAWGTTSQNKSAGKSRFERMSIGNGQAFHNHNGSRHTDLTQVCLSAAYHGYSDPVGLLAVPVAAASPLKVMHHHQAHVRP